MAATFSVRAAAAATIAAFSLMTAKKRLSIAEHFVCVYTMNGGQTTGGDRATDSATQGGGGGVKLQTQSVNAQIGDGLAEQRVDNPLLEVNRKGRTFRTLQAERGTERNATG
jgi:hypothetical protein